MISENARALLAEIPPGVELVAAVKGRRPAEVVEAIRAGIKVIGENYLQEAEKHHAVIGKDAKWHFIGSLQQNKIKAVAALFDMVETIDSDESAKMLDRHCARLRKEMPVLIEINSGREPQKSGVMPEQAESLITQVNRLPNIKIMGLMTMGPRFGSPEDSRKYFIATRKLFEQLKSWRIPNVKMNYLSMGMTNSYRIAIEEGANIIRIGTKIFGDVS